MKRTETDTSLMSARCCNHEVNSSSGIILSIMGIMEVLSVGESEETDTYAEEEKGKSKKRGDY